MIKAKKILKFAGKIEKINIQLKGFDWLDEDIVNDVSEKLVQYSAEAENDFLRREEVFRSANKLAKRLKMSNLDKVPGHISLKQFLLNASKKAESRHKKAIVNYLTKTQNVVIIPGEVIDNFGDEMNIAIDLAKVSLCDDSAAVKKLDNQLEYLFQMSAYLDEACGGLVKRQLSLKVNCLAKTLGIEEVDVDLNKPGEYSVFFAKVIARRRM